MKVAFIGAGSLGFTRRLVADLLSVPEFEDTEFSRSGSISITVAYGAHSSSKRPRAWM